MSSRRWRKPRAALRPERSVRRSILALVLAAVVAFALVGTASVFVARHIAREDALSEAVRSARTVSNVVFAPLLPEAMSGDIQARDRLDRAVRIRTPDGSLVRVKVWARNGKVIYSDDHSVIGKVFPTDNGVNAAIDRGRTSVGVSNLDDAENVDESAIFDHLVQVYLPLTLDNGTRVAFELYSTDARLKTAERRLIARLVPFALGALLVLLLTQLPVAVWLVRRVGDAQQERARLLGDTLAASGRERRNIARDLHDGVVQDLAGAGYALGALARALPPDSTPQVREMLDMGNAAVQRSVHDLRALIVDINPPDLTADGLGTALHDLGDRLRATGQVEVEVAVMLPGEVGPGVAATVYRSAREFLANVAKHAAARHVTVELRGDTAQVWLCVTDDGRGLPPGGFDRRAEGHVGLMLLADAARDLGGEVSVSGGAAGGTTAVLVLPARGGERG
jgi:two-component system, NarL family, sensor kinase